MILSAPCQTYLITDGSLTPETFDAKFAGILKLIQAAVGANISLIQIREKAITARQLFELTKSAASLTENSPTKLLINDRADIAFSAGADGVHLTSHSLSSAVIRDNFPREFIIGVSTHSREAALAAKQESADFVVFGPVFATDSKAQYGAPQGVEKLRQVVKALGDFPVFALGGVNENNYREAIETGAGIAAISFFYQRLRELNKS